LKFTPHELDRFIWFIKVVCWLKIIPEFDFKDDILIVEAHKQVERINLLQFKLFPINVAELLAVSFAILSIN